MLYLSQLLGRNIYYQGRQFGKILDMAIFLNKTVPPVSKIEVQHGKTKITIPPYAVRFAEGNLQLITDNFPHLPFDHTDLYLGEDLLDKQVIDVDGRRLVRVNDVILENGHELKVSGIDVGINGILRRLGLGLMKTKDKVLPWRFIEAFDYDTGTIKLRLRQNNLAKLHPAEIADILEDAGAKERLGIVESLNAKQAARAIEEADEETQLSILENLTPQVLKDVINTMHISELADVFHDLNPLKSIEIQKVLGIDKLQKIKVLSSFSDTDAGGLMHELFTQKESTTHVEELIADLKDRSYIPEIVIVTHHGTFLGTLQVKDLLRADRATYLAKMALDNKCITQKTSFHDMLRIFTQYNLRVLPVINDEKIPIGIVLVDELLKIIDEEQERDENL